MSISQIPMIFDFLSGIMVPTIAKNEGVGMSLSTGAYFCLFSFASAIVLVTMDEYAEKHDSKVVQDQRAMCSSASNTWFTSSEENNDEQEEDALIPQLYSQDSSDESDKDGWMSRFK